MATDISQYLKEVDSIVKSVSSYESLAKNFGVNEDVIYTVKAMFR